MLESVETWELFDPYDAVYRFTFLLHDTVTGLIGVALFARPLLRTFGCNAKAVAFLVTTPWMMITCTDTAFDPLRWITAPARTDLRPFEAGFPALLLVSLVTVTLLRIEIEIPDVLLAIFHPAPVIRAGVIDTIQRLPDPVSRIRYGASARAFHLSGRYGPGVAAGVVTAIRD